MVEYPTPYIFDLQGLLAWAKSSSNESQTVLADVQNGDVIVYNRVWNDFCDAYPDEAAVIEALEFPRTKVTPAHRLATAAIADVAKATFGWRGPYDKATEWCVAGIACCESYTVVTDERRMPMYKKIDGLWVMTFGAFLLLH